MSASHPGQTFLTWTSSAEASPVKTYRSLGRVLVLPGLDLVSGTNTRASFAKYDHESSSWKTYQRSLFGGSESFLGIWPKQGMIRNGCAFALVTSAHLIAESGSSLWPTPQSFDANECNRSPEALARAKTVGGCSNLRESPALWPTPTAEQSQNRTSIRSDPDSKHHDGITLLDQIKIWEEDPRLLNPAWVEHLMGFPPGWTDIPPSMAESSRKRGPRDLAKRSTPGKPRARRKAPPIEPPDSKP